jgi:hypothetical protein
MADDRVLTRFEELVKRGELVLRKPRSSENHVDNLQEAVEWSTNVRQIVRTAFGDESEHYRALTSKPNNAGGEDYLPNVQSVLGNLKAALSDWVGGYHESVKALARVEAGADLLTQAEELEKSDYHRAAAVLAGATLEEHLRGMCTSRGIDVMTADGKKRKTLEPLNQDLHKHPSAPYDLYWGKKVTAWGDYRNKAAHGEPFDETQTKRFIEDITEFCARFK